MGYCCACRWNNWIREWDYWCGGGIFLSPVLLLKKWATPKGAAATSALFIWVNSLAGLGGAALSDQLTLEWGVLFPFVGAVLIGWLHRLKIWG